MNLLACSAYWNSSPLKHHNPTGAKHDMSPDPAPYKEMWLKRSSEPMLIFFPGATKDHSRLTSKWSQMTRNSCASHCPMWSHGRQHHQCVICANQRQAERENCHISHQNVLEGPKCSTVQTMKWDLIKAPTMKKA